MADLDDLRATVSRFASRRNRRTALRLECYLTAERCVADLRGSDDRAE